MIMEVKPFKAFRYDKAKVGDAGRCIAPPYDVISDKQREELYGKSEYNIVRVIRGKTEASDSEAENQYTRAAKYLNEWIASGVLKQDTKDAIYGYVQNFRIGARAFERVSFVSLAKLEEFGKVVRPHEQILKAPTIDRLNLKRATKAKFGLVFMLYKDQTLTAEGIIEEYMSGQPLIDFADEQEVRHRLFAVTDAGDIDAIVRMMSDKSCIIADGHHRYTTGLMYSKETDNPNARFQMLAFCNTCHEGLVVLATHRLVSNLDGFSVEGLIEGLKASFEITAHSFDGEGQKHQAKHDALEQMGGEMANNRSAFVMYAGGKAFYSVVLKDRSAMDSAAADMSKPWRSLDVAVLHKLILERLLGIDAEKLAEGTHVEYVKDAENVIDESIERVDAGEKQAAFFMNPPKIEQIESVADEGERMPQKSTYFYPKVFTGLTINKL
jgi:uncharacterized protein (DUF1015 family)